MATRISTPNGDKDAPDLKDEGLEIPKVIPGAVEMAQEYVRQLLVKFREEAGIKDPFEGNILAGLHPNEAVEKPLTEALVYLVDDEVIILNSLKRSLARKKITNVKTFINGREALESMYKDGQLVETPHLVITDTNMPRMGGEVLARDLQKIDPVLRPRVIALTGRMEDKNVSTRMFI